jgi:DNA-binding NtrC family response regulator
MIAAECLRRSSEQAFHKYRVGSTANLALNAVACGEYRAARQGLEFVLQNSAGLTYVEVAALDNLAQVELAEGNLNECHSQLSRARDRATKDQTPGRSWNDLANDQTRCAYFERMGNWQEILAIVERAEGELARRQFRAIHTTLLGARARALARLGDHAAADDALASAVQTCPRGAIEPQITLEASRGLCLSLRGDRTRGRFHLDRATSACRAIGHRYHQAWIDYLRATLPKVTAPAPAPRASDDLTDRTLLLSDVSTLLGAGHSLDLLAQRAVDLLRGTSLDGRVRIETESGLPYQPRPDATWTVRGDGTCEIRLSGSDRALTIRAANVRSLDELALLKSVADLARAAAHRTTDAETDDDRQHLWPRQIVETGEDTVFQSPRMMELLRVAARLADTQLPVLITGETGTGKEILARLIHDESRQRRGPFVPFNCSSIPRELVESQLFGHRRGAFTGAMDSFPGVIRAAENGTLFLDELGDLDPAAQPKLLRFLESGEVHPVGEARAQRVAVRVVAATNTNLDDLVAQGRFRSDLFYRVGVARIELPPLRDRKDEIPAFAALFLKRYSRECGRTGLRLGDDFIAALLLCDWPGNIRQLANEMRRVVALAADGSTLTAGDLAPDLARGWNTRDVDQPPTSAAPRVQVRLDQTLSAAIQELEQHFIEHALDLSGGRVAEAARRLGLSRKGLFLKRRRRGMTPRT